MTATSLEAQGTWGRYGKRPLVVLSLVGLVDAVDRGVIPGVLPLLQHDLGLSDAQAGYLSSAIIIASLLVAVPGGLLADRRDRRSLITAVLGLWALSTVLSAAARSFAQLFVVRAVLGAGDSINDPAAQSLVADYYPPQVRGRAYGWQRVVPTVGTALGIGLGGVLGQAFGWRTAVLVVGVPGLLVALLVRRLPLPERGEHDPADESRLTVADPRTAWGSVRTALAVPSLRALLLATAVIIAVLSALTFWGLSYHVRASGFSEAQAGGVVGVVVGLGAVIGGYAGGIAADRLRGRVEGAAMVLGAATTSSGTLLLLVSFVDGLPVYTVRLPLQLVAVGLIVAALPALTSMTSEVVPNDLRGTAFGLVKLSANLLAAATPPLLGYIADHHQVTLPNGDRVGDLGFAFRSTTWFLFLGSLFLLLGRRHVEADTLRARASR